MAHPDDSFSPAPDDTVHIDFDNLEALEEQLGNVDRGREAALRRIEEAQSSSRSTSRSISNDDPLEEIELGDIGPVVFLEEGADLPEDPFTVEGVPVELFDNPNSTAAFSTSGSSPRRKLVIEDIIQEPLGTNEYYPEKHDKHQIYLHHTVSPGDPMISIRWWRQDRSKSGNRIRVATFVVVAGRENRHKKYKDGEIYQCYSSRHWAHHLGITSRGNRNRIPSRYFSSSHNRKVNRQSIGIELSSWGPLAKLRNGKFAPVDHYKAVMKKHNDESRVRFQMPAENVIEYSNGFRGYQYFEKYTPAQIEATWQLLDYLCDAYDIPRTYHEDMWDIYEPALRGDPGIFTHTSVRADKSDCHPQPELVEMLKSI